MNKKEIAVNEIKSEVDRISKENPSGEAFFDALDEFIKHIATDAVYDALAEIAGLSKSNPSACGTVVVMSGGFGRVLADRIDNGKFVKTEYILFEGGMRKGNTPNILRSTVDKSVKLPQRRTVFLDDTIYGGLTFRLIQEFLSKTHKDLRLDSAVVVYDGRPEKRTDVDSIFRYYDYYSATPNFKF